LSVKSSLTAATTSIPAPARYSTTFAVNGGVRGELRNPLGLQRSDAFDQGAGAGHHRRVPTGGGPHTGLGAYVGARTGGHHRDQARVREHIALRIGQLGRTPVALGVHRRQGLGVTLIVRIRAVWKVKR
jgi:hypothetical protein